MRNASLALMTACVMLVTALAGCAGSGQGSASVYVKDAPTDTFSEVHLVITKVVIHQSSSGNNTDENGTAGWKTLFEGSVDVDLLNTTGAKAAFLGEAGLPAGKYQQLRLEASSAYGIKKDGTRVDIDLPVKELKVVRGLRVEADKETQIVIDIDLEKSLQEGKNGYAFKPVLGKLTAGIKEKSEKPTPGTVETVNQTDDA